MPDEPNKQIDETLRAYARERRKAADISLQPSTRNLLQGEVRRVFGAAEPQPWWKRLRAFWPQLTFAGSMCLILGIAILSLRQPPRSEPNAATTATEKEVELLKRADEGGVQEQAVESKLKERMDDRDALGVAEPLKISPNPEQPGLQKNVEAAPLERAPSASAGTAIAPPQLPSTAPQESLRQRGEDLQTTRERVLTDSATAPAPIVAPEVRMQKKFETPAKADEVKATASAGVKQPSANERLVRSTAGRATSVGLRPDNVALAADMTNLGAARRLNFVQVSNVNTRGAASTGTNAVLAAFQVEQLGNNVKFLDRDGSIYIGELEATNSAAALAVADDATKLDSSAAYYFRVQGTNRTLGKDVVLVGEYFEQTNTTPSSLDTFAITPATAARPKIQPRHLIIGNATVGSTNQVPVRAVANEP